VLRSLEGIEVGYYPQLPGVNVKLTARARDASAAAAALDRAEARLREALGSFVVGTGNATLAGVVGELLLARGWTLGTAESCTGGEMAAAIVAVPGASRYFQRGVVAYARRSKIDLLGVPPEVLDAHGEVSEATVRAMAEGMRTRAGVDVAVATTGIAGPSGATEEKPVGLVWSAIAWPGGTRAWRTVHPGDRGMVIARSVAVDLNRLRLLLLGST
jgi:nicotinamide-nucleotide amidase